MSGKSNNNNINFIIYSQKACSVYNCKKRREQKLKGVYVQTVLKRSSMFENKEKARVLYLWMSGEKVRTNLDLNPFDKFRLF